MHQKSGAQLPHSVEWSGPCGPSVRRLRSVSAMSRVLVQMLGVWRSVLYVLNLGHTGCSQPTVMDQHNTEYGRNQPGTLLAALTMHNSFS